MYLCLRDFRLLRNDDGYIYIAKNSLQLGTVCTCVEYLGSYSFEIQITLALTLLGFIMKFIYSKYQGRKQARDLEISQMMKEIIDVLQNNTARHGCQKGIKRELVRDQIIPIGDTCAHNRKVWKESENRLKKDSRLTIDQKIENGEEAEIWKWSESTEMNGDLWQGRAFASNGPTGADIPAECLKIRNMLAANDRDVAVKDRVTSAIKEWCKGLNGVTSIDFSIPDGVVYVKLISKAKAGEAYRRISANWYNRKLVMVKYILLERYHRRFPQAKNHNSILV